MPSVDISMVLFRPRWEELGATFLSLSQIAPEFRVLRLLLSGTLDDRVRLREMLEAHELTEQVELVHRWDNLGFASGHNLLLAQAFDGGADACLVLNPDTAIAPGALTALMSAVSGTPGPSLMGPSLSSEDDDGRIVDSLGIAWTRTGRHVDRQQGTRWAVTPGRTTVVDGVTGACLLVSAEAYVAVTSASGYFFDDWFLAYREDAELGVRARGLGVSSVAVELEGFAHGRHVKGFERGNRLADLLGVRNRFLLRWALGRRRPGTPGLPTIRDITVALWVIVGERSSLPGLVDAWMIRRSVKYRRRRTQGPRHRQPVVDADGPSARFRDPVRP